VLTVECNSGERDWRCLFAFCSAFGALLSVSLALLTVFYRQGMVLPGRLLGLCLSVFLSAVFSPFLIPGRVRAKASRYGDLVFLLPVLVLLSPLLILSAGPGFALVYPVLALVALVRAAPELLRLGRRNLFFILVCAPALAFYLLLSVQSRQNGHLFLWECGVRGLEGGDNLFHAAICSMIQYFGKPSVGMDGFTPVRYHLGSHYWFAALGRSAGTPPLLSYSFAEMIVLLPGFIFGLISCCLWSFRESGNSLWRTALLTLLLLAGLDLAGINSHYVSQSHTFALLIFMLCLPMLMQLLRLKPKGPGRGLRLALAIALIAAMTAMKISVGALFGAAVFYVLLRSADLSPRSFPALALVAAVVLFSSAFFIHWNIGQLSGLLQENGPEWLLRYYTMFRLQAASNFIVPVSFLAGIVCHDKLYRPKAVMEAVRGRTCLEAELAFFVTALAAAPTIVLHESDSWFFMNVAQWFALPFLLKSAGAVKPAGKAGLPPALLIAVVLIGSLVALESWIKPHDPYQGKLTISRRSAKSFLGNRRKYPGKPFCGRGSSTRKAREESNDGIRAQAILKREADKGRQGLAVFVPPENARFWAITSGCYIVPFFVPSVAGLPMLKGLPPKSSECDIPELRYGYDDYGNQSYSSDATEKQLCDYAAAKGIRRIFILNDLEDQAKNRTIDCPW